MATPSIDRTLRGLQELRTANPREVLERVEQLEAQRADIDFQLYVLMPIAEEARRRINEAAQGHVKPAEPAPSAPRPSAPALAAADQAGDTEERRPPSWKADAIIKLLAEHPHEMLEPDRVRQELRTRGEMSGDEGTPTSVLLRRLADRGQIATDGKRYGHLPAAAPRGPQLDWTGGS